MEWGCSLVLKIGKMPQLREDCFHTSVLLGPAVPLSRRLRGPRPQSLPGPPGAPLHWDGGRSRGAAGGVSPGGRREVPPGLDYEEVPRAPRRQSGRRVDTNARVKAGASRRRTPAPQGITLSGLGRSSPRRRPEPKSPGISLDPAGRGRHFLASSAACWNLPELQPLPGARWPRRFLFIGAQPGGRSSAEQGPLGPKVPGDCGIAGEQPPHPLPEDTNRYDLPAVPRARPSPAQKLGAPAPRPAPHGWERGTRGPFPTGGLRPGFSGKSGSPARSSSRGQPASRV